MLTSVRPKGAWAGQKPRPDCAHRHAPIARAAPRCRPCCAAGRGRCQPRRARGPAHPTPRDRVKTFRSEEHTSELQSLMRISYAVFCLKKKKKQTSTTGKIIQTTKNQ